MDTHRNLRVWQDAKQLVLEVYAVTRTLPPEERFVTGTQLRRAAWSVANNIAEGNARRGRAQLRHFLNYAIGSLGEIDSMLSVLAELYPLEPERTDAVQRLRVKITRGVFKLMRAPGR